ncbi:MAG: tetratricopeptide repeat protein [Thiomargarita sp.]|nr:tetratricopeptide repeat protein [Thiomargarita sp.]
MSNFHLFETKEDQIARFFNIGKAKEARQVLKGLQAGLSGKPLIISLNRIAKRVKNLKIKLPLLKEAVDLDDKDVRSLTAYANALVKNKEFKQAFVIFEKITTDYPDNVIVLTSYSTALLKDNQFKKASQILADSCQKFNNDAKLLTNYAIALVNNQQIQEAFDVFKRSLKINERDTTTLNSYGKALADNGKAEKAFDIFERALTVNEKNTTTLTSYGKALAENGKADKAFEIFERALTVNEKNTTTLNSYGKALAENGKAEEALEKIQRANELEPNNPIALATYGVLLAIKGELKEAFKKFDSSLKRKKNLLTFTNYGKFLIQAERFEEAIDKFEQAIQMDSKDNVALFLCADALQLSQRNEEAIEKLEAIDFERLPTGLDRFISLTLIRLCYQTGAGEKADTYINNLIEQTDDQDGERLRVAQNLFAVQRQSEKAFEILSEIQEKSPEIQQALTQFIPHLKMPDFFKQFHAEINIKDTEMLNRGMYHKIQNLVAILKDIIYEIIEEHQPDENLSAILPLILETLNKIKEERKLEQNQIKNIPHDNYPQIIDLISKTAHHIVDFVNNKLSVIREDVLAFLEDFPPTEPRYEQFDQLLTYIKSTQSALNDLKDINQGIKLKNSQFEIKDLFAIWQKTDKINFAKIILDIQNPDSQFIGDKEKINSFINELIENSLKHNPKRANLKITISSRDSDKITRNKNVKISIRSKNAPRTKNAPPKYLLITVKDNGQGIPDAQKHKIFLPLFTTTQEGTGLGLFMIKRTLEKMHGAITETGKQGAFFRIRIPYQDKL